MACCASGLTSEAFRTPAFLSLLFRVMAWPLRLRIHGVTIGFTGDPASPIVDAKGIPRSMCVAWFSPSDSLSLIAAHDASFEITESMPNFLK